MKHYTDADDFYSLFEAGTFDWENVEGGTFKGYVRVDEGLKLAAVITHDRNGGGMGWYDDTLV